MRDPERLLSTRSDADALERELLSSLREDAPSARAKAELWQGIAIGLAAVAPVSVAAASAAAASSGAAASVGGKGGVLLLAKWVLVGALGAGAASGAFWVAHRANTPAATAAKQTPKIVQPKAASAPAAVATPQPAADTTPEPPRAIAAPLKRTKPDALAAESELLRSARAQLRAGDLAAAERSLSLQRKRFRGGALGQERDVLQIELFRARGDAAGVRRLAGQFLRAHPESPHAAQLRALLAAP